MSDSSSMPLPARPGRLTPVFIVRASAALVQAAALYALLHVYSGADSWLDHHPGVLLPLLLASIYVPLVVMVGAGHMRARALVIWAIAAGLVVALLGLNEAARGRVAEFDGQDTLMPRVELLMATAAALFFAHVLVVDGIEERRMLPSYERHFNTAWKLGLQICLAALFVGAFWLLLEMGAELFRLLGLYGFRRAIDQAWVSYPATTLALAVALHLTDIQPALIRGVRVIVLTLFSWLLPLLAAIVLAFLCCLPVTSLEPLWRTNFAGSLLLATMATLVLLINSHYQDGTPEHAASRIKRVAATASALMLLPLCGLAVRAMWLRVDQYGWTAERVLGSAAIAVAACYALGYVVAALRSPARLKGIETANVLGAYVAIAVMLAIFSPLADPARLMVATQVERLRSGAVDVAKFDFAALKYDGARWGKEALEQMKHQQDGADAKEVRERATSALASTSRWDAHKMAPLTPEVLAERITMLTPGRSLPQEFLDLEFWFNAPSPLQCMSSQVTCTAAYLSLVPGKPESLLIADPYGGAIFDSDSKGKWTMTAALAGKDYCAPLQEAMRKGPVTVAEHNWKDLIVDGVRYTLLSTKRECPPDLDKQSSAGSSRMLDGPEPKTGRNRNRRRSLPSFLM